MASANDFRRGRHVISALYVHLVFVPKYRGRVISPSVFDVACSSWEKVCSDFGCELEEANYEPDHVHLLVSYPPKVALAKLVNSLKGVSSRRVRAECSSKLQGKLWGAHFWSPSYCAVSCGGAALEIIKRYVQSQKGGGASE